VLVTLLFDLSTGRDLMYALMILGNIFGRKMRWVIGGSLSGFHMLSSYMHLSYG